MKTYNKYIIGLAALSMGIALPSCQNDFDDVKFPAEGPTAVYDEADVISIYDLKKLYWNDNCNYIDTIPYVYNDVTDFGADAGKVVEFPLNADGTRKQYDRKFVIKGRVISSDVAGNVYKKIVIQDETAAMAFSVNRGNMSSLYNYGQEIIVDCNGLYLGKYNGGQQFGYPSYYASQDVYNATFMPYDLFRSHIQLNGMPDPSKVIVKEFNSVADLSTSPDEMIKVQSNLCVFKHVYFPEGGKEKFCSAHKTNTNRMLRDYPDGTQDLIVRTSGYSKFWDETLPEGEINLMALVDYYQSNNSKDGDWQLTLNGLDGILEAQAEPGDREDPYTVDDVIAFETEGVAVTAWMTGYIVGTVGDDVEEITKNDDIVWIDDTDNDFLVNTLVIAADADCRDYAKCVVVVLPQGSNFRQYGNLVDNEANAGKQIWLKGSFVKSDFYKTWSIDGNFNADDNWEIDGVSVGGGDTPEGPAVGDGNGSKESPYSAAQVIAGTATGTAWVKGYIVGWVDGMTLSSGAVFSVPATANTNLLIAATPGETNVANCVPVQLPSGAIRSALNLVDHPDNFGKELSINGSIEKYFGAQGVKSATEYVLGEGGGSTPDVPNPPVGDGDGSAATPWSVAQVIAGHATGTGWTEGYIVGWIDGMTLAEGATFTTPATVATNLLVAPTPGETNVAYCVPVQLPSGAVRSALNLVDHPDNLGKKVKLNGSIEKYFGTTGIKTVTEYELGEGGGTTPDVPVTPGDAGTVDNPYTVAQVIAGQASGTGWAKGYIVGWINGQVLADGATFTVPAEAATNLLIAATAGETNVANCVPVQLPAGAVRTALNLMDNPGNLGKEIALYGSFEKYFGTAGIKTVTDYLLDGQAPSQPEQPTDAVYSGLITGADDWTLNVGTIPEGLTYVWAWDAAYGLKASAYANGSRFDTDIYAVSPAITLTAGCKLTFEQAINYQTNPGDLYDLCIREKGTDAWTALTVPTWPAGNSWTFTASGDIDLSAYAGKTVEFGFHYVSTSTVSGTWEIKNFIIK